MLSALKILIVDDDPYICQLIRTSLKGFDCECTDAYDGWQALEQIETGQFDLVLLDIMLPGPSGIEILRHIHQRQIDTDVIVLTAYASLESAVEAIRLGAYDYITKPFSPVTLRAAVEQVLEKRRLAAQLTAIYDLGREIVLLSDVKRICEAVLATVRQVLEFQTCSLGLIDEERNQIYWLATCGVEPLSPVSLNGGNGITAAAVQAGEPIYVPDVREDPRYIEVKKSTRSELAVPIEVRGRVIGVLNIESDEVDAFSPQDIKLLSILAAQTGGAIENARLHEESLRRTAELAALNRAGQILTSTLDLDTVLASLMAQVCSVTGAEMASVLLHDADSNELVVAASVGTTPEQPLGMRMLADSGIAGWTMQTGQPVLIHDTLADPRFYHQINAFTNIATRSLLAAPLIHKGNTIGVIEATSSAAGVFDKHDLSLLTTLADSAAIAIENARLYNTAKTNYEYYRAVTDSLHDEVLIIDRDYRVTDANAVFLRRTGYTREEIIGRYCYELTHNMSEPCCGDGIPCPARQVWESGQPTRFTQVRYDREGIAHWLDVAASPLRDPTGRVTHVIEAYRDMTTEQQLQERLTGVHLLGQELVLSRDEQQIAQVTADAAIFLLQAQFCGMWVMDVEENRLTLKAHAGITRPTYQYAPLVNDEGSIIAAVARTEEPVYVPDIQAEAAAGSSYPGTGVNQVSRTVLCVPLKVKGKLIGVLNAESNRPDAFDEAARRLFSILADYSALALENARLHEETARLYEIERELRTLMEQSRLQLMENEKLAAMGRLAASLAHEINNPLQAIHNSLQLMLSFPLEPDEQKEYLQIASEEVKRLTSLVTRMLDFARRPRQKKESTDLNDVIEKVLNLTHKYMQHHNITLQRDLAPDLPAVLGNKDELGQVFLNILLNGVEAMPDGGTLYISSQPTADGWVEVAITDTGRGIPPDHLRRIFEPFFSTKEHGTGLGLYLSYNIIKQHGGEITVQSTEGKGATFTIRLPKA